MAKQGPVDSFLASKTPWRNSQECLDLEEESKKQSWYSFSFSACTFYERTKIC